MEKFGGLSLGGSSEAGLGIRAGGAKLLHARPLDRSELMIALDLSAFTYGGLITDEASHRMTTRPEWQL